MLGLFYFGFILYLMLRRPETRQLLQLIFYLTLFVLIPSLYLSFMEYFVIKAFCILCETSKILMLGILLTSGIVLRGTQIVRLRMALPVVFAGFIAAFITYMAQTGTTVKQDYSNLVSCMNERGVVYYKSVRCNNCKRQEKLLGDAYKKLNQVECHPDGQNPQPELCLAKRINKTPTFLIEQDGTELKRVEGLQPIEALAAFAGCKNSL
jgi:hypothetical protein